MHVNEAERIMKMIQCRKHNWTGHVLRHEDEGFLLDIIEGKMRGKATRGRKKTHLLHNMMENRTYISLTDLSRDRTAEDQRRCRKETSPSVGQSE